MNGTSNLASVVNNGASNLAQFVNNELVKNGFVIKHCLESGVEVKIPEPLYKQSLDEQAKGIKQEHFFKGGYLSPRGGVFRDYQAFHDWTQ